MGRAISPPQFPSMADNNAVYYAAGTTISTSSFALTPPSSDPHVYCEPNRIHEISLRSDGAVTLRSCHETRTGRYYDVLAELSKAPAPFSRTDRLLPRDCIFYSTRRSTTTGRVGSLIYLIEKRPAIQQVELIANSAVDREVARSVGKFQIAIPWHYFLITVSEKEYIHGKWMYWSPTKLEALTQHLAPASLPNLLEGSAICMGHNELNPAGVPLNERINNLIDSYWLYPFNGETGWHYPPAYAAAVDPYKAWEEESLRDPLAFMKWPWDNMRDRLSVVFPEDRPAPPQMFVNARRIFATLPSSPKVEKTEVKKEVPNDGVAHWTET